MFARLGQVNPQQGGPYAYARDFLGPYAGFQTNYIYWFGNWVGNIAIAVAAVGYLSELIPGIDAPPASTVVTALIIWILTFANILGPRVVGALEAWTMALALIPIVGIALLGWFWFDPAIFQRELECQRRIRLARHHARRLDGALGLHGHRERRRLGRRHRKSGAQRAAGHHHRPGASPPWCTC